MGEREMHLVADHGPPERGVGLLPPRQRVVRNADCTDGAAVEQVAHPGHDHRVGDHRVGLVHLVQRDSVQPEPLGAGALPLLDDRGKRGDGHDLAGHHDVGALVAQRLAQDPLAFAEPVYLGGVEQRDPQRTGPLHDVASGAGGVTVAVAPLA
jgi:hypothetical protein